MTSFMDDMIWDMGEQLQKKKRMQSYEERLSLWTKDNWLDGVERGVIELDDPIIKLVQVSHYKNRVRISLPNTLTLVHRGISASVKDQEREHDQIMYADEKKGTAFSLNWMTNSLESSQVGSFKNVMMNLLKQRKPNMQLILDDTIVVDGRKVGVYECIVPMKSDKQFQICFMTSLGGRPLLGNFHYSLKDAMIWQPLTRAIIEKAMFQ